MHRRHRAPLAFAASAFLAALGPAIYFGREIPRDDFERGIWIVCPLLVAVSAWLGAHHFVMRGTPGAAAWRGALVGLALLQACILGLGILQTGLERVLLAILLIGNVYCAVYCAVLASLELYLCRWVVCSLRAE